MATVSFKYKADRKNKARCYFTVGKIYKTEIIFAIRDDKGRIIDVSEHAEMINAAFEVLFNKD